MYIKYDVISNQTEELTAVVEVDEYHCMMKRFKINNTDLPRLVDYTSFFTVIQPHVKSCIAACKIMY